MDNAILAHRLCNRIDYSITVGRSHASDLKRIEKARDNAIRCNAQRRGGGSTPVTPPVSDPAAMSDDDLLATVAAWETGRAQRWAPIQRLKGAKHLAARAKYMEEKAAYDRVKAEATRRGLSTPHRPEPGRFRAGRANLVRRPSRRAASQRQGRGPRRAHSPGGGNSEGPPPTRPAGTADSQWPGAARTVSRPD